MWRTALHMYVRAHTVPAHNGWITHIGLCRYVPTQVYTYVRTYAGGTEHTQIYWVYSVDHPLYKQTLGITKQPMDNPLIQGTESNSKVYLQWNGRTFSSEGSVKFRTKTHCLNNAGRVDHPAWIYVHSSQLCWVTIISISCQCSYQTSFWRCLWLLPVCLRHQTQGDPNCVPEREELKGRWSDSATNTHHKCQKRHWMENALSYESLCKKLILKVRG